MSDIADDFFLVGVKAEDDFGVLEVVVAAASVGFIRAEPGARCQEDHRGDREDCEMR